MSSCYFSLKLPRKRQGNEDEIISMENNNRYAE